MAANGEELLLCKGGYMGAQTVRSVMLTKLSTKNVAIGLPMLKTSLKTSFSANRMPFISRAKTLSLSSQADLASGFREESGTADVQRRGQNHPSLHPPSALFLLVPSGNLVND